MTTDADRTEAPSPVPGSASDAPAATPGPAEVAEAVAILTGPDGPEQRFAAEVADRRVEYDAIAELLMRERTPGVDETQAEAVARAIAAGCLGERHLWRDLGLPSRPTLRAVLETYFGPFAAGNTRDMRWKKFTYRRLCGWEGVHMCRAPSCSECDGYPECFGSEDE